jgi:hypothetical protein
MIYRARTGTKVKVANTIAWDNSIEAEYYADRVAKLGSNVWKVEMSLGNSVGIRVDDDVQIIPKKALDRAA